MAITFGSLFSGVEGFGLGFEQAGMECVWQVERDKDCLRVLSRHFPGVVRVNDVNRLRAFLEPRYAEKIRNAPSIVRPDWICGGFPCQDLSVAGRRAGLAGSRSGLWYVFRRILGLLRPGGVCIENVPGLLSSNGGRDMGIILSALGQLGYGWAYRVVDAQWFGVPQRRRRVFIVGCLGDMRRAAEILFERDGLPWDSPPRRETRTGVAALTARGVGTCGADDNQAQAGHLVCADVAAALDTKPYADHEAKESRLIGVDITNSRLSGALSGTLTCELSKGDRGQGVIEIAHTLRGEGFDASEDGTGRGTPQIPVAFAQNQRDEVRDLNGVAGALAAEPGMKQQTYVAFGWNKSAAQTMRVGDTTDALQASPTSNPAVAFSSKDCGGDAGEVAPTMRSMNFAESRMNGGGQVAVAFQERGRDGGRLIEAQGDLAYSLNSPNGGGRRQESNVAGRFGVRRLTPRECERLQGFPDDWTRCDASGSEISDSARYRMLGNAVNVKCSNWIGRRIVAANQELQRAA